MLFQFCSFDADTKEKSICEREKNNAQWLTVEEQQWTVFHCKKPVAIFEEVTCKSGVSFYDHYKPFARTQNAKKWLTLLHCALFSLPPYMYVYRPTNFLFFHEDVLLGFLISVQMATVDILFMQHNKKNVFIY